MARLFGTDGVRGLANKTPTASLAIRLDTATAIVLTSGTNPSGRRPLVTVGRDPRVSGKILAATLSASMASQGAGVLRIGVLPTPAVTFLTDDYGVDMGVMISASHNPMPDDGIKFFAAGGTKLDDTVEEEIEHALHNLSETDPTGTGVGHVIEEASDGSDRYLFHLSRAASIKLDGIRVVVNYANGAASQAAPMACTAVGADVVAIHDKPSSYNINDNCGSTHTKVLRAAVLEHGTDLGLAHDGDADRCLAVDSQGNTIDGDQIMAILAVAMKEEGLLHHNTLVVTVMSSLGLKLAMEENDIVLRATKAGDRYVLADLSAGGCSLGGEQSGHVVIPDHATTGDGTLTGLCPMTWTARTGKSLAELASVMKVLPQTLINVPVSNKAAVLKSDKVKVTIDAAEEKLDSTDRVLSRPSGIEELFRVMVEAADAESARKVAGGLAAVVAAVQSQGCGNE